MPILTSLRSGIGAGFTLLKSMWRPAPDPAPGRVERYAAPGAPDFANFRQRLINALQFRQPATAVLQNPFVSPPPHATIIDLTGILSLTFNSQVYAFADYATAVLKYTCPDDHVAVIRFWGFTGIYSADEYVVNEAYENVVFSLLDKHYCADATAVGSMTGQIPPHVNMFRPGPAEAVCLNAMIPLKPGQVVIPVAVAKTGGGPTSGMKILCRLWGWHWPHGEPGAL